MGQNIHKWGSYLGIDWVFNTLSGVSFAYWGKYTELGQKAWSGPVEHMFEAGLSHVIKNEKQLASSVEHGSMFASIIMGGMMTIPPLMILENRGVKKSIVQSLDRVIYGNDRVERDPTFQQAYAAMDHEPKKNFTTGMLARFAALTPLLAIILIPETKEKAKALYFDHIARGSDMLARGAGLSEETFAHLSPQEAGDRWKHIHNAIAMDFGLGLPYAGLHSFFYDKFAGISGHGKESARVPDVPAFPEIPAQGGEVHRLPTRQVTQATAAAERTVNSEPLIAAR